MNLRTKFNCYIDEAGDEGLGEKSSPWFVISAIIVRADEEREVMNYEREAIQQVWVDRGHNPPKQLHWRERTHPQRMAISRFIIEKPYTQIVVGVWKEKLTRPSENGLKNHSVFYEYACKLILERISWYVDDNNGLVDITFSRWGSLVKADLQAHIAEKMKSRNCQIRPVFDVAKIEVLNMKDLVMLRFADNCASAIGNALNPDEYGELNYLCSNLLSPHLYRYRGRDHALWKYGVKVFPAEVSEKEFIERYPHTSKWFE